MGKKKKKSKKNRTTKHEKTNAARFTEWLTDNEITEQDLILAGLGVAARSVRTGKRKAFKKAHRTGRRLAKAGAMLEALNPGTINRSAARPTEAPADSEPVIAYQHNGGGWYSVEVAGIEVDRLQGEQPAAERAGALLAAYAVQDARTQQSRETSVSHVGGGWYEVKVAGVPVDRVRGKSAVEERYGQLVS